MSKEDQIEWKKMIGEILTASDLKHGCKLTKWELARMEEWGKLNFLSDKKGSIVERIYKEKML